MKYIRFNINLISFQYLNYNSYIFSKKMIDITMTKFLYYYEHQANNNIYKYAYYLCG